MVWLGKKEESRKQDDTLVQPIEENITVEEDADAEQITPENTKVVFGRLGWAKNQRLNNT